MGLRITVMIPFWNSSLKSRNLLILSCLLCIEKKIMFGTFGRWLRNLNSEELSSTIQNSSELVFDKILG